MKREILCAICGPESRKIFPEPEPFPGEFAKYVEGALLFACRCDCCGSELAAGATATAFSLWTTAIPYFPWEGEYLALPAPSIEDRLADWLEDEAPYDGPSDFNEG